MFSSQNKFSVKLFFIALVQSKLFLSFAASLLAWQTFLIAGVNSTGNKLLFAFIFFATLFAYNIRRLRISPSENDKHSHWNLQLENSSALKTICAVGGLIFSCVLFFQLKSSVQSTVVGFAACTFAYIMPLTYSNKIIKGIRNIFILKNIWLALVWACVTVILPLLNCDEQIFSTNNLLLFFSRFIFIYTITLAFDIRDMENDAINTLKTLPTQFGITFTKSIALFSLLAFCVLIYFRVHVQPDLKHIAPAFYISAVVLAVFVLLSQPKNKLFFYEVLMDGMLVLQAGMVYFFSYLK